jgi:hypothetical protein
MWLRLVVPPFDRAARRGSVTRWLKAVGERVRYGEDLVDITVEEIALTARSGSARSVLGAATPDVPVTQGGMDWPLRVTASDEGVLRRIEVGAGGHFEIGDALALLSTEADEPIEAAPATQFRVVVNPLEDL